MKRFALTVLSALILLSGCASHSSPAPTEGFVDVCKTPEAAPSAVPEDTAAPDATASPTPALTPVMYKSRVNTLNCRSSATTADSSNIVCELSYEEEAEYLGTEGDFTFIRLADGREVYCYSDYLVPAETVLYAYLPRESAQKTVIATGEPVFEADGVTPVMVINELVDLRLYLPDAQYELLFATDKNITGAPLYARAIPLMQKGTAEKFQKAFALFKADGYTVKVYDAYRPKSVQKILYDIVQNRHWIANPATTASNHNRGCAVDMSLIDDATGLELVFPTPMHTFSDESARTSASWSDEARANVDYMTEIMKQCGFNSIESEWWHFSDTEKDKYMTTDIDLGSLNMLPKQEG